MNACRRLSVCVATALALTLPLVGTPIHAADIAKLSGSIMHATDQVPLEGARIHAGDPKTGNIYSSAPAGPDGGFVVESLPASTYALAVESAGGLYVVETPVSLAPGVARTVNLAVRPNAEEDPPLDTPPDTKDPKFSFKENPLTATLITLGVVTVIGVALDDDSSNPTSASPMAP